MKRLVIALTAAALMSGSAIRAEDAAMPASTITATEWSAYQTQFVAEDGRVIDNANGDISHSEGQGYGLLLAYLAGDKAAFEKIWSFTRTELIVRDDGLAAWRWDASATPHITDTNNATDGDILIAYALALAGQGWSEPDKLEAATTMIKTVAEDLIVKTRGDALILPGSKGFRKADRKDGPVVNPSYWVFEAFPLFARISSDAVWNDITASGQNLIAKAQFGTAKLPTDWISMAKATPRPADGFPPEFGYNSIRVPLYLMRAGLGDEQNLAPFNAEFNSPDGAATMDVKSGKRIDPLVEPGYRIIGAAMACVLDNTPIPAALQTFAPESYFGSTLQLLTLDYLRKNHGACLSGGAG